MPLLTGSHHVIRIDLLGHNRTAEPDGHSYAIPDQARRAGQALDRLGVEHATAVGGAKAELLPDLGHSSILEAPSRTATSLPAFTAEPRRPATGGGHEAS